MTVQAYSREWLGLPWERKEIIEAAQEHIPVPLGAIANAFGIAVKVATLDIGVSGSIKRVRGQTYEIQINRHDRKTRQRFTLAHELAHFLLHQDQIGDGIVDNILYRSGLSESMEYQANRLAADILMPRNYVLAKIAEMGLVNLSEAVEPLSQSLNVSEEAIIIRLGLK